MPRTDSLKPAPEPQLAVIQIRGARVHNLKNIDLDLPRNKLIAFSGVSGSGKSSLAFDTLFAEGQRRYLESVTSYARQFLEQVEPPDVDEINGLPPTIAIDQRSTASPGPRSTVGTITEILDHLRLAYARLGTAHCTQCNRPITRQSPEQMVRQILEAPEGRKILLLAPLVRHRKGHHQAAFATIRREGLIRARIDGQIIDILDDPPRLDPDRFHSIEAVVDRLVLRPGIRPRLAESVDRALKLSGGSLILSAQSQDAWSDQFLSSTHACIDCGISLPPLEPRHFSFNNPQGACPRCQGLGLILAFDPELILPDRSRPLDLDDLPFRSLLPHFEPDSLATLLKSFKIRRGTRIDRWPASAQNALFQGLSDLDPPWPGLIPLLESAANAAATRRARAAFDPLRAEQSCPACQGSRLNPAASRVKLGSVTLPDLIARDLLSTRQCISAWPIPAHLESIARPLQREVLSRLAFLERVGLAYLSLDRRASTLSGGELQRVRLASQLGSALTGVCYILDEPTAGLHPLDTKQLLDCLLQIRDAGNTVILVEHDEASLRSADWLLDLGPGPGPDGGEIVAFGPPSHLTRLGHSPTAEWLAGERPVRPQETHRLARAAGWISILGASHHNLKNIDVNIPQACLTAVAGPSGSGKSSLILDILARAALRLRPGPQPLAMPAPGAHHAIRGLEGFDRVILVDQSPLGRTPRSNPATYTGLFDELRRLLALTREARIRGFSPSRFSLNQPGGRCEACKGYGTRTIPMQLLPDLVITCETCQGARFNPQTLEVQFKGLSIAQILELRVDQALPLFDAVPAIASRLNALQNVGLGYLTLGRSSLTLSGGEAQRVKLAAELAAAASSRTLFILDEPTTGLHPLDVARLLDVLNQLVQKGATVVVIEHHLDVISAADWVVELGPAGGAAGGCLIHQGSPDSLLEIPRSPTAQALLADSRMPPPNPRQSRP